MTLATDGLLGERWTVDGGLEMLPAEGGIASTDVPQCNASHRRWHHFLPKPAMRPETLFKDCIYDDIIDSRVSNLRVSSCVGGC